jgi:hypothetical protein
MRSQWWTFDCWALVLTTRPEGGPSSGLDNCTAGSVSKMLEMTYDNDAS